MKFKKPLSLLLAAVLLCAFAVPLLETPALAADKEIHEVATAGVYKWITITAGEGGAVTEVVQTGGVLPPGMSLGKNEDVSSLFGTPTTPGTYILTGETHYEDNAASWVLRWKVRLFVDFAATRRQRRQRRRQRPQRPARRPHRRTPRRRRILRRRLPGAPIITKRRRRRPWRSAAAQRLWQTPPAGRGARGAF